MPVNRDAERLVRLRRVIRAALRNGAIRPGSKNGAQKHLAMMFGVSRQRVQQLVVEEAANLAREAAVDADAAPIV